MIESSSIESLKQRLDIVDVVGSYIELKKNGANFKALCPFHADTTPSLVVSPAKQIYHCFACGAGGDSVKFVMEYERLSYPEALEKLAHMCNFTLTYTTKEGQTKQDRKLLESVNGFFIKTLDAHPHVHAYIADRGITEAMVQKFELGFAPSSQLTLAFLREHGFLMSEAIEWGVAGTGESGAAYARFIERLTFPIYTPNAKLVGFGGRTLSNHPAKYVNSPQSKYFNKSALLYGYHLAKESIYHVHKVIVTEGYLDVIMLHQAGFTHAVATLGTALTSEHLPLLLRGDPEVILAYDGDNAGIAAALKASMLLSTHGIKGGVVLFGEGMDPADMVHKGLIEQLDHLFRAPQPFIEFALERIIKKYPPADPLAKQAALEEAMGFLKSLPPSLQESYASFIASLLNLHTNTIKLHTKRPSKEKGGAKPFEDMLELTIIKTLLLHPAWIDTVLDTIDASMFKTHTTEFALLLQNDLEHPMLRRIMLWEDIKIYNENELIASMLSFLHRYYTEAFLNIKQNKTITFEQKGFLIRKIQEKLHKLKSGELVPYESINTYM